ncbi:TIM barrel protein [Nonomuraea sp. KC401]|uniref:TIM barrel protein n=1 Tax=unclassified Nonomuraea TaxID=2593643 RepID=UPI0010FCEA3B|nr:MULTISPECIES: TIM barrel protein [unclassified Nonomuraea]NBE97948.1 TIM barrel protein [Nonomuraea sp. K271]TLF61963.1 TIM barrel protein [Nonomuraea sp. KC401]
MLTADHGMANPESRRSMSPPLALATVCLSGTLEDKLAAASAAGFNGIEIYEGDLIVSSWSPSRIRQECADLGLSIHLYQPFHDFEAVPPETYEANLRRAERKFDVLERLGAKTMAVGSTTSMDAIDDDDLAAEQLHVLADRAARRGLRIAYEGLAWGRFVNTLEHAWRIVQRAGHPALGLCIDSFHVFARDDDPASVRAVSGSKVFHLQLADAPRLNMDALEGSEHHRLFPGQGVFDLADFVGHVLATGYDGPLSLEVFNDVCRQADPRHVAVDAMRSLLSLQETVGTLGSGAVRDRILLPGLPPAPQLDGHVFTELAVDESSGPIMARALTALGFSHTGQHRSKPVQLWQQGMARILLNFAPQRTMPAGTATICALAVESADPVGSARRAERLLAPVLPRTRQEEEANLESVAAPDGTAVFFCRTGGNDSWLNDFDPTGREVGSDALLTGTDHVSLTEPVDDFDQAALFYRSVLGLQATQTTTLPAPFGLLHSRAATDSAHHVRISLNTAPLRRGYWSPGVPSPQHIAFTTDDAIESVKAMRALGAPLLRIPDNYYDDLDARLTLPQDLLTAMRQHSILYDRDQDGEYLHFYTEMFGSRIFFEVVQRVGNYAGYGSSNSAAVRMAAHRRRRLATLRETSTSAGGDDRHDYSLAHLTALSLSPPELVSAAADAGYRYVGLRMTRVTSHEPHHPLATDPALMRATKVRLAATGIEVLDMELARIAANDDPANYLRFLEAGAELGARHVITQLPDPDFSRKADRFARLCELARPLGLTIDLEFPSWTQTPDLSEAVRVLRDAGQSNAGILVDLIHFARSGSSVAELRDLPPEWFHFAHVCDAPAKAPATQEEIIYAARFERLFPGEGGLDLHGILGALPSGLPYALEIPRATLVAQVGAKEHARLAITAARRHLDGVSRRAGPTEAA